MNIIFFLIDIAWDIFWGLAKLAVLVFVSGAISYSLWWLFFESAAGPYLIGAVVIAIILRIVGASTE
jgi:hypothetical protein